MRPRAQRDRLASYLVIPDSWGAGHTSLTDLAAYLSTLAVAGFDVIVAELPDAFDDHDHVLRWVGHHVRIRPQHRSFSGWIDPLRVAMDVASCHKVIVADDRVRYSVNALREITALLDAHEVVQPQDYLDPLPWWGGIDAGRMLLHRGLDPLPDHGATFGFNRGVLRGLRAIDAGTAVGDPPRRLAAQGAEVFSAVEVFVRRIPPLFGEWIRQRPRHADNDFSLPLKSAFFLSLLPIAALLSMLGGTEIAACYAAVISLASLALAMRGRVGAAQFFPRRACLYAPLWVLERSLSVYWALFRRLPSMAPQPRRLIHVIPSVSEGRALRK
jgi:hypothetical protein